MHLFTRTEFLAVNTVDVLETAPVHYPEDFIIRYKTRIIVFADGYGKAPSEIDVESYPVSHMAREGHLKWSYFAQCVAHPEDLLDQILVQTMIRNLNHPPTLILADEQARPPQNLLTDPR